MKVLRAFADHLALGDTRAFISPSRGDYTEYELTDEEYEEGKKDAMALLTKLLEKNNISEEIETP